MELFLYQQGVCALLNGTSLKIVMKQDKVYNGPQNSLMKTSE